VAPATILKEGQRLKEAGIGAQVVGIPADSQMYQPLMIVGRWLQPGDGRVIVVSKDMADDNNIQVGDTLTLNLFELGDAEWQVIGVFDTIFSGGFDASPLYAPLDAVYAATKQYNEGSRLLVRTTSRDAAAAEALYPRLKNLYEDQAMALDESATTAQDRLDAMTQINVTTTMLLALAVIVALVGGMGLMGALSIGVVERTREIGVMRAIGARTRTIMGLLVMEGMLQGVLSWLMAASLSLILFRPLANALRQVKFFEAIMDYQYNAGAVLIWLAIILVISTLASILPARNATRISVRESLAYL
jgi:putative ABC transport system permease protein